MPAHIKPGTNEIFKDCSNLKFVSVRSGNKVTRSTNKAWFKDPTPPVVSTPSSSSTPAIDPNSMSWPRPIYESPWDHMSDDEYVKRLYWDEKWQCTIRKSGKYYYVPEIGSYDNYIDAEGASYFMFTYGLTRTRGLYKAYH
jgi:hypothetical protein